MKEERKRILKMVEEGKLTVDEALTLMEELEKAQQTANEKKEQIINELSTVVKFEEAKKEDPFQAKYQSTKDKIFDFVDSALKKIKEIDFDFNFGKSVEISHIFHHGDVELKNIDIDIANGSVKIAVWDQPDVRVECQAKVFRVENQDQARHNFLRDVVFAVEGQKLKFNTQQKWMKVDAVMFVPKAQYEHLRIRLFNGPITGSDMMVDDLHVKTANGKIQLDRIYGKRGEIETANGKIDVLTSNMNELEAETINGAIRLEGDFKKTEAQSFNGNISYNLSGSRCEWIHAKTTSGTIDVFVPEILPVNGELKTNLGGFNLKLTGVQILEEKSEMIQKLLRFQSVNQTDQMVKIYAETKTGSISLQKAE
ncbi:DUF4097 domain-containing protein [Neobacillus mesonae]|uniref:DUF4097 family beta strand repeat-containing protein n=1 Tax=Neobacillus mesonae TaxID=1193713 RepID=UPI0020413770|nr:DUF4097 domain-containing protein [Neobacillus mesonae]MCM3567436.1 DUF4097 family beta strand repeat-containing protein [Neobacillus mesonae]